MEKTYKIEEISHEPILIRKSKKFVSRLPRLTTHKDGRLVLFTDNVNKFIEQARGFF